MHRGQRAWGATPWSRQEGLGGSQARPGGAAPRPEQALFGSAHHVDSLACEAGTVGPTSLPLS